mmetsp:Transcript_7215/g.19748  ORF Transcript_7215/g.19748 Transcript_7215/m.19748 type:complete len:241 (+) Transcript_7215:2663-3385(+)
MVGNIGPRTHAHRRCLAQPQPGRQATRRTVRAHQHPPLDHVAVHALHRPQPLFCVKRHVIAHLELLHQLSASLSRLLRHSVIQMVPLDGTRRRLPELVHRVSDIGQTGRGNETTAVRVLGLALGNQRVNHSHILQDMDRRRANGVTADLLPWERLLVQQRDLGPRLGQIVPTDGSRRTGTDDDGIVAILRQIADREGTGGYRSIFAVFPDRPAHQESGRHGADGRPGVDLGIAILKIQVG